MEGRNVLAVALIIVFSVQFYIVTNSQQEAYGENLVNATMHPIPRGLPWYHIVVFGDNRPRDTSSITLPRVFYEVLNYTEEISPYAVIGTGDHVGEGTKGQIEALREAFEGRSIWNVWLGLGNHDVIKRNLELWEHVIAPSHYMIDSIPGWRIVFLDDERGDAAYWRSQLENATLGLDGRRLILVLHKPYRPNMNYNLDYGRARIMKEFLDDNAGKIALVLQGHWHGYAQEYYRNITWIITGGAGAPLYKYHGPQPGNNTWIVTGVYHYVILTLYANQSYKVTPIAVGGIIEKTTESKHVNGTLIVEGRVYHNLTRVDGEPVIIPVRFNLTPAWTSYIALTAPAGVNTSFKYVYNRDMVRVESGSPDWYAYITVGNKSIVLTPANNTWSNQTVEKVKTTLATSKTRGEHHTTSSTASSLENTAIEETENTASGNGALHAELTAVLIVVVILAASFYLVSRLQR